MDSSSSKRAALLASQANCSTAQSVAGKCATGTAIISDCGLYRYRLSREVPSGGKRDAGFIMVNPSTADATEDDATIRKVRGFCERHEFGRFTVANKFAFRATDVKALRTARDPVGPDNNQHIEWLLHNVHTVIVAWGPLGKLPPYLRERWHKVAAMADRAGVKLMCLGTAQDGQPRHPLMLAYDTPLTEWKRPT